MKQHMQTFCYLLSKNDDNALRQHYLASGESENIVQLAYLFQQGINESVTFEFHQKLATTLIASKCFPSALIAQIKTNDTLSFFTPGLQLQDNFKQTDHQQRNALHYLLAGNKVVASKPPFIYLRSMMLFGSNDTLRDALCQRDHANLTPIEVYLSANQNLNSLPAHELTALLALIEIESKQQTLATMNYSQVIKAVTEICHRQNKGINSELQRLILIAIYYKKAINDIVNGIS
ncbi:hypothetical protein [Colwellia hornerae]|uniref:Orphan protein n=1 Tax=Colwellia hornerae TaxID=89402 RepID=A0A5C6Q2Y2_9GAMM|nr:hypothetical protein [Colwellia hornerae]TWX52581.1 hypothetical protein ESZ28_11700 [Colwellia hornerae]TWX58344.1 hypothetical protein ESZ26_11665 [Colwellia hornerae]TWX63160.1 hypothetical protein ESZ27_17715 [Colwellia hornerae]